jgi:hypothetical protein
MCAECDMQFCVVGDLLPLPCLGVRIWTRNIVRYSTTDRCRLACNAVMLMCPVLGIYAQL